ncbi:MAG: M20/M25/M40 family metallo-hydrolase [Cyclobacteriaceae bacterium]|nr:M20/M25/M40 family metallo-hydrolase [Cyclobacteriaceae bacterium]
MIRVLIGAFLVALVNVCAGQDAKLSKKEKEILAFVDRNHPESVRLLERAVNINSGTLNLSGVKEVGKLFGEEFRKIGFGIRWIDMPPAMNRAGHLFAERRGTKGKRLLLIGHLDTVFEPESPFQQWTLKDTIASGPGVNDMKGGDVILLFALKALEEAGALKDTQIVVALHGDEEHGGDPEVISRGDIVEAAKRSDLALAFETATGFNYGTVARRGASSWQLKVKGKRAHSGGVFNKNTGAGAIYEAARILNSFYEQLQEQYLTFNPGLIVGGSTAAIDGVSGTADGKTNVVAETAIVNGDLRFISEEQKVKARQRMRQIVEQHLPQTDAEIVFEDGIPSMPPTQGNLDLLAYLNKVSIDLGMGEVKPWDPGQRGAGDISYVAPYISGIDGLGAMGTGAHTLSETINLRTFADLTKRTAILIYRLTREVKN